MSVYQDTRWGWDDLNNHNVSVSTRVTHTPAAFKESVMKTQTVDHNVPARTTSVLTHAACHVAKGQTAQFRTMWPSADVPGALQEILSGTAGGSQGMRFVLPVEPTLTVRYLVLKFFPEANISTLFFKGWPR